MSFLVAAALALGLLVAAPVAAHLLRRGRAHEQEFPPAGLVPVAYRSARRRSRLEDRWLLIVRALLILVLSIVGAVPFVRCSRLALDRDAGASVALALVIDDSLSMRTMVEDTGTRWEHALTAAKDLLKSTREGDAVGIVLAGKPARLVLAATTDLGVVRDTLDRLRPEDRATDLTSAVRLAQSALKTLPHVDKRTFVLSDFASQAERLPGSDFSAPLDNLRQPSTNCGIVRAQAEGRRVVISVACTGAEVASKRKVRVVSAGGLEPNRAGKELGLAPLQPQSGTQQLELAVSDSAGALDAFLTGSDDLEQDDYAAVAQAQSAMAIGVVADSATAAAHEGTPTVIEQALNALAATNTLSKGRAGEVRPLSLIPEDANELQKYAALIIDDPPGFTPEARKALAAWLAAGGFAAAFLGPNVEAAQLGGSFEPFAHGALTWESTAPSKIAPSGSFLGDAGASLHELAPKGRLRLTGAQSAESEVILRWDDGIPWMLRRRVGQGQLWTFGLPVSVAHSDLALRPGFLALLERFVHDAAQSNGQRVTEAGAAWRLPRATQSVEGPEGKQEMRKALKDARQQEQLSMSPAVRGRYVVLEANGDEHQRIVTLDEQEIVSQPRDVAGNQVPRARQAQAPNVEVTREFAVLLLVLVACELLLRFRSRLRLRRQNPT